MAAPLGEFGRIARFLAPLAEGCPGAVGLKDDGAILSAPDGWEIAATKDMLVEGVHFLPGDLPRDLARKMLRVNLSDLASMGAMPWVYLLSFALPKRCDDGWLAAFAEGLAMDQREYAFSLAGGDSVSTSGPIVLDAVLLGLVEQGRALRRTGAGVGEDLWLSGTLGDGALGLLAAQGALPGLDHRDQEALVQRYRLPQPRIALGRRLVGLATAAMDVSDGLAADAAKLASASGLALEIDTPAILLSDAAVEAVAQDADLFERVLTGGDDYELLFTAPVEKRNEINALSQELDVPLARVGRALTGEAVRLLDKDGVPLSLAQAGWVHG